MTHSRYKGASIFSNEIPISAPATLVDKATVEHLGLLEASKAKGTAPTVPFEISFDARKV